DAPVENTLALPMCVHNPLRIKYFHETLAGNTHECSLKSRIGEVSPYFLAYLDAKQRHGFVPQKANHGSDRHQIEIRDWLGVEEARERLIARDEGTTQDQTDNDDASKVFRTTQTIGEALRRWTSREHKGHPERQRSRGITKVVDGIRQERYAA